jgi:hypothetical protein
MRKVTTRAAVLLIGISALVLVTATRPALAKEATLAETTKSAHCCYAYGSKRGHWCRRRGVTGNTAPTFSHRRTRLRPPTSDETDQLLQCLFSQPFVTCDASAWHAQEATKGLA